MLLSEKVTLVMLVMTIIFLMISVGSGLEAFVVLILIGVFILRELIESFAPNDIKDRINFFIYTGLIIFVGIVIKKIMYIL